MSEAGWIRGEPQASDVPDAKDGISWPGSGPEHEQATPGAQGLPLSVEGDGYWSSQSGMEYRYHLYSYEAGLHVPDSHDRLVQPLCSVVGTVKYDGKFFSDGLSPGEYETARVLMILMVINLVITFPNSVFICIILAHERFIFQRLSLVIINLITPILTITILFCGFGTVGMIVITTSVTFIHFLVNIWYVCARMKERFIFNKFYFFLLGDISRFTFFIFLNQVIDRINWSVDTFLLGRMIDTAAVAIYGVGAQINSMYLLFSTTVSSVFVPRVNRIVAETDDNIQLSYLFTKIGRIQFMILTLILSGFIFFGKPFIRLWGGNGFNDSYYVALWLIIPVTVPLIQNLGIEIQRAKNKHQARSVVYFLLALGNILLSIPLIKHYGPIGASIGTSVSLVIGNILFMNWYYHKRIGINIPLFWKNIFCFAPALTGPAVIGVWVMNYVEIQNPLQLVLWAIAYSIFFFISMWTLGMNGAEKKIFLSIIGKIMRKAR